MNIRRITAALICALMLAAAIPFGISSGAASAQPAGAVFFEVEADGNTFTVSRSSPAGALPVQKIVVRTVGITAIANVHFAPVRRELMFGEGETSKSVTVTEYTSSEAAQRGTLVDLYQSGTTRRYRLEALDTEGFLLASAARDISYSASYCFNNELIAEHDGESLMYVFRMSFGTGYPESYGYHNDSFVDVAFPKTSSYTVIHDSSGNGYTQGVWSAPTDALFARAGCASREYLSAVGDSMYAVIGFTGHAIDEGYEYIQVLADNSTTCDGTDPDGSVNTPSVSVYKACFELNKSLKGSSVGTEWEEQWEDTAMFPKKYGTPEESVHDTGGGENREFNSFELLHQQKFKNPSFAATNTGALVLDPAVSSLSVRFNARGKGDDDWSVKDIFARLSLVDIQAPCVLGVAVPEGLNAKHNRVSVTVAFSEIVKPVGEVTLATSWGTLTADAIPSSQWANAITFSGEITAEEGTALRVEGITGTVTDLHGIPFPGRISKNVPGYTVGATPTPQTLSDGAFSIACQSDLFWLSDRLEKYPATSARLACDVNMTATSICAFRPMCARGFSGVLDGAGHRIYNLKLSQSGASDSGLFALIVNSGAVRDLTLDASCSISASSPSNAGGVAAVNLGTIERCAVECRISAAGAGQNGTGKALGGIAGVNAGRIESCRVGAESLPLMISNAWSGPTVGGVAGRNSGVLRSSFFFGKYNSLYTSNVVRGAVCGTNTGTVADSAGVSVPSDSFGGAIGSDTGASENVLFANESAFFSGEVCYTLNGGVTDGTQTWRQTVPSEILPAYSGDTVFAHGDIYVNSVYHLYLVSYEWNRDDVSSAYTVRVTATCTYGHETYTAEATAAVTDHEDPTCTAEGYDVFEASFDDAPAGYGFRRVQKSETIPALGHEYGEEWTVDVEPTETTPGSKSHRCVRCGEATDVTEIPPLATVLRGDANGDGKINAKDLSIVKRLVAGNAEAGTYDEANADVDGDGKFTAKDISALKRLIAQGG